MGIDGHDDAGIFRLDDETALVQTLDFFSPIVDDPWDFGRVAAANALSDVWAMGGRPLTAMNIVGFPIDRLDKSVLTTLLAGGLERIQAAGAVLVGGHSVKDEEIKYGLSVTGRVHPKRYMHNGGARPGQVLVLTKALGTGLVATALKAGLAEEGWERAMVDSMIALNEIGEVAARCHGCRGGTDVTGFGLLGHACELAQGSRVELRLFPARVPALPGAREAASDGLVPGGTHANRSFFASMVESGETSPETLDLLYDPQTSGGLLLALDGERLDAFLEEAPEGSTVVGEVRSGPARVRLARA